MAVTELAGPYSTGVPVMDEVTPKNRLATVPPAPTALAVFAASAVTDVEYGPKIAAGPIVPPDTAPGKVMAWEPPLN